MGNFLTLLIDERPVQPGRALYGFSSVPLRGHARGGRAWGGAPANTYTTSMHPTSNLSIYINRERSKRHQLAVLAGLAGIDDHQIFLAASSRRGVWTSMVIAILAYSTS